MHRQQAAGQTHRWAGGLPACSHGQRCLEGTALLSSAPGPLLPFPVKSIRWLRTKLLLGSRVLSGAGTAVSPAPGSPAEQVHSYSSGASAVRRSPANKYLVLRTVQRERAEGGARGYGTFGPEGLALLAGPPDRVPVAYWVTVWAKRMRGTRRQGWWPRGTQRRPYSWPGPASPLGSGSLLRGGCGLGVMGRNAGWTGRAVLRRQPAKAET